MMHESDTSHDSTDHEMSIVDDHENGTTKESINKILNSISVCELCHFDRFMNVEIGVKC